VGLVISPGRFPVVQVTVVVVAVEGIHLTPSITIVYLEESATKLVPVNVSRVPPLTVPNLGSIDFKRGVRILWYEATEVKMLDVPFKFNLGVQP
jgi:hypothetical protein